jgi:hypothetical protein
MNGQTIYYIYFVDSVNVMLWTAKMHLHELFTVEEFKRELNRIKINDASLSKVMRTTSLPEDCQEFFKMIVEDKLYVVERRRQTHKDSG